MTNPYSDTLPEFQKIPSGKKAGARQKCSFLCLLGQPISLICRTNSKEKRAGSQYG